MPTEVFAHPTVKSVAFEIRFPHLFSIENRIGEFQEKIIMDFPESKQILRQQIMFTDSGTEGKFEKVPSEFNPNASRKIWSFASKDKTEVKVQTNSLAIVSIDHKTYNNEGSVKKFRDVIDTVVNSFFAVIKVPLLNRIGLRYIDFCPVPTKDNDTINRLYDLTLPTLRFPMNDLEREYFEIITKRKNHKLIFRESLLSEKEIKQGDNEPLPGPYTLILDFDGFDETIASSDFLKVADELHEIISEEYFSIIKEPIKEYMRTGNLP